MPRWNEDHVSRRTCPDCGGPKDFYAEVCRKCKVWGKPLLGKTGENHPAWSGGQRVDKDGYILTYAPGHPWPRRSGYVRENVRVMELHVGRRLKLGEVVHHRDKNRLNNEISNLEILSHGEHSSLHRKADTHLRRRDEQGRFAGKEVCNA